MNEQEFFELAAGYALNALEPDDRAAFEHALRQHPEWAERVDADIAAAASLAEAVREELPPLTARSTLLARIAATPQTGVDPAPDADVFGHHAFAAAVPPRPPLPDTDAVPPRVDPTPSTSVVQAVSRRNWTRGLFALAASLVLLVTLGWGAASINEFVNRPPAVAALAEIESAPDAQSITAEVTGGGIATAHWSESLGKAVLVSSNLPGISADEEFEMWVVDADGAVSAGTFAAGDEQSTVLLDAAVAEGDVIALTVETAGGSPTGQPTSDPIVAIPTA
ncbi:anti-sigma factor [Microbacterium aurantiacum]|uniref:Regulator of SigK n=1 Tax=Microbacterium aurantiacum TaxID=162393 RepID=A0AAJ2HKT2_9MICO|nr:anti-sigma factor [Microbacterium aurantiacum]MDS0245766.1 anti-sigma factor [Microbacterium aurantiacum]